MNKSNTKNLISLAQMLEAIDQSHRSNIEWLIEKLNVTGNVYDGSVDDCSIPDEFEVPEEEPDAEHISSIDTQGDLFPGDGRELEYKQKQIKNRIWLFWVLFYCNPRHSIFRRI